MGNEVRGIFTVRNEVAKVMFLHLSVILSTGGGVCLSACWDTTPGTRHPPQTRHPPGPGTPPRPGTPSDQAPTPDQAHPPEQTPLDQAPPQTSPPGAEGYCCERYASYWNAFLFALCTLLLVQDYCMQLKNDAMDNRQ